ncbi:MAG: hypothetical protein OXK17_08455 [Thaumarchaeota archaeon]|nr:hypothetical protein [Nitrososphaerota archaeon]
MARLSLQGVRYVTTLLDCDSCRLVLRNYDSIHSMQDTGPSMKEVKSAAARAMTTHFRQKHAEIEKQICAGVIAD